MDNNINKFNHHRTVLLQQVIELLKPTANQNFIDATLGSGGHTSAILKETAPQGKVMGFDWDPAAVDIAKQNLKSYKDRVIFINDNYSKLKTKINEFKFDKISGIICDLGYSSLQMGALDRGFSFQSQEHLDMRYNPALGLTASDILNKWPMAELEKIFQDYSNEVMARAIAKNIVELRQKTKITGTGLRKIVERVYARRWRTPSRIHPATRVWQALRIAVNNEFANLEKFLPQAVDVLIPSGRLAVISFHSGEDRIVKNFIRQEAKDCICPKEFPKCICNHKVKIKIITKKPIIPTITEIKNNPRARSAKLRVVEKI